MTFDLDPRHMNLDEFVFHGFKSCVLILQAVSQELLVHMQYMLCCFHAFSLVTISTLDYC